MGLVFYSDGEVKLDEDSERQAREFAISRVLAENHKAFEKYFEESKRIILNREMEKVEGKWS